MVILKKLYFTK